MAADLAARAIADIQKRCLIERVLGLEEAVYYCYGSGVLGDLMEFGTGTGLTANTIGAAMLAAQQDRPQQGRHLYLFDSFDGLPKSTAVQDLASPHVVSGTWREGACGCPSLTADHVEAMLNQLMPGLFCVVPGWFKDTVEQIPDDVRVAFVHVDSDLYQSTIDALDPLFMRGQISDGAVLCFDDWNCNLASPEFGERRAFADLTERYNIRASPWGFYSWSGARFIVHGYQQRLI